MTLALRTRLSLAWRTVLALVVLGAVSAAVATTAVIVTGTGVWLLALLVVGIAEVVLGVPTAFYGQLLDNVAVSVVASGLVLAPVLYVSPVRAELREIRAELNGQGTPADQRHPEVAALVRRLAQQAGVPEPAVSIVNRSRPVSYAVGTGEDATIVLTRGLIRQLDDDELAAVVAHEISHLANGDSRVMTLGVTPMLVADRLVDDERPDWFVTDGALKLPTLYVFHLAIWAALRVAQRGQVLGCRAGVSVLSRGREFAADESAARLTGSPAALASALRTLDGRGPPAEDARTLRESAGALDILPQADRESLLLGTHPDTDARIARLEAMAAAER